MVLRYLAKLVHKGHHPLIVESVVTTLSCSGRHTYWLSLQKFSVFSWRNQGDTRLKYY
jgi:hypothetical protein